MFGRVKSADVQNEVQVDPATTAAATAVSDTGHWVERASGPRAPISAAESTPPKGSPAAPGPGSLHKQRLRVDGANRPGELLQRLGADQVRLVEHDAVGQRHLPHSLADDAVVAGLTQLGQPVPGGGGSPFASGVDVRRMLR